MPGFAQQAGTVTVCVDALLFELFFNYLITINECGFVTAIPVNGFGAGFLDKLLYVSLCVATADEQVTARDVSW